MTSKKDVDALAAVLLPALMEGLKAEGYRPQAIAGAPAKWSEAEEAAFKQGASSAGKRPARASEAPGPVKTSTPSLGTFGHKDDDDDQARIAEIAGAIDVDEIAPTRNGTQHAQGYFATCVAQAKKGQETFCAYMDGKLPGDHKGLLSNTTPRYAFSQMLFDALVDEEIWS